MKAYDTSNVLPRCSGGQKSGCHSTVFALKALKGQAALPLQLPVTPDAPW